MSTGHDRTDRSTVVIDQDLVDVCIVGVDLGNDVDRRHADRAARVLSLLLVPVAAAGAALTVFAPGVLHGPAVMNGSARGTALVILLGGLPTVLVGLLLADRGAPRGRPIWAGGLAYVVYNAVLLLFATPFNQLFLVYVAMLSLSLWGLVATMAGARFGPEWRAEAMRPVAVYLWIVVTLNALAWLRLIVPDLGDHTPGFLAGTGMTTNPVFVQDLAVWLPLMAVAGLMLWSSHPWGLLVGGAGLVYWQLEAVGVAVDQWFGHHADPASTVATYEGAWLFAALFVIGVVPTTSVLRRLAAHPVSEPDA